MSPSHRSIAATCRAETRVQGSRFIATALPIGDEAGARAGVEAARREFPDATHHCWAFRLATGAEPVERAHDAGEPAGTAGPPILQAIRGADLSGVLVVVTRHFGGTKLGKGGLARAYREAARAVLDGAPRVESVTEAAVRIVGPIERDGEMRHLLARHGGRVTGASYADPRRVILEATIPAGGAAALRADLEALTRGAARVEEAAGPPRDRRG